MAMTGLERLKFKCECCHADGIIRMTRDQLRDIIEQIERETNQSSDLAVSRDRKTIYDRIVLKQVEELGGLDAIKKNAGIAKNESRSDVVAFCTLEIDGNKADVIYSTSSESMFEGSRGKIDFAPMFNVDVQRMFEAMSDALIRGDA